MSTDPGGERPPIIASEEITVEGPAPTDAAAPCPMCAKAGRGGSLDLIVPGRYECKTCLFGFRVPTWDEVPALLHDIQKGANEGPVLLSPGMFHLNPEHKDMFYDAWANIVWGRNNAGLLVLGALIESVLREVIEVHRGVLIKGGLFDVILYCRDEDLAPDSYLDFAEEVRREVRNLWQHQLAHSITTGGAVGAIQISWDKAGGLEGLEHQLKTAIETAKTTGMQQFPVDQHRWAQYPRKQQIEAALAPLLYNHTWFWLLFLTTRVLKSKHYGLFRTHFGGRPPKLLEHHKRKGGVRVWKEIPLPVVEPFEKRRPPMFRPRHGD